MPIFDDDSRYLDRFGLVLALTVLSVVLLSFVDLTDIGSDRAQQASAFVATSLTAVAMLLALRASGVSRGWRRGAEVVVAIGLVLSGLLLLVGDTRFTAPASDGVPPVFPLLLALVAPIVVVRRLLSHRRVRRATLLGAVSVYLLIALASFYAFLTVELMQSGDFFGRPEPTSDLMYFSLTTITTVGYGDLTAAAQPGRLLANTEAVVGQLYLVTFVGLLIGILTTQQTRTDSDEA